MPRAEPRRDEDAVERLAHRYPRHAGVFHLLGEVEVVFGFWAIVLKEFIQMKRDRVTFAMMVGIPMMQLLLFGYAINSDPKHLPTAIRAADQGPFARTLVAALKKSLGEKAAASAKAEPDLERLPGEVGDLDGGPRVGADCDGGHAARIRDLDAPDAATRVGRHAGGDQRVAHGLGPLPGQRLVGRTQRGRHVHQACVVLAVFDEQHHEQKARRQQAVEDRKSVV